MQHQLIAIDGSLYFPYGGDAAWGDRDASGNVPSILMQVYAAGDCDTVPWPLQSEFADEPTLRQRLAAALYDERETSDRFAYGDTVALPDGTPFDFDSLVR